MTLSARLLLSAGAAAIDRHLLSAGRSAANPPHTAAAVDRRADRQTDRRTPDRYIDLAEYAMREASITVDLADKSQLPATVGKCVTD